MAALGARKPDRAFFERTQARLPVTGPSEVLSFDDSLANPEAASALGWRAYAHTGHADLSRAIATA